jgi:hypothetical protein
MVMSALQILFKTSRFNLTKMEEHFINACCFAEDLAVWRRIKLFDVVSNVPACGFKARITQGERHQTPDASATVDKRARQVPLWLQGKVFRIKRVDAGVGNLIISITSALTIDGVTTSLLSNQWQLVTVVSDAINWLIEG